MPNYSKAEHKVHKIKAAAHLFRATAPIYFKGFITFFFLQSFPI